MAEISEFEIEAVWDEFHRVVNMTSTELSAFLTTEAAAREDEGLPADAAGSEDGQQVLAVLQKRRMDLTDDDVRLMLRVVDTVDDHRDDHAADQGENSPWRRRMMLVGHDPLKPRA
ncbi:DUF3140 domain-containing protein [Streptomyces sp. NPDC001922]|uniref:DUF3140 domain-containing protein n=1 Tax=Streptomyces sp. NPDC001922 TaxID=3364624 RepID=UPI0036CF8863